MVPARKRIAALLLATLAFGPGCRGAEGSDPLWTADLGYLSRETFARSSFRADGVLVQGRDALQLLDPATGAARWTRPVAQSAFPAGELAPIWVVGEEGGELRLEELDPSTGATRRTTKPAAPLSPGAELTWAGQGRLLVTGTSTARLVDVDSGATIWERTFSEIVYREQLLDDWILVRDGASHRALALSDGSERWQQPGTCCAAVSASGPAVYLPISETRSVRVDLGGAILEEIDGAVVAVDPEHVAILGADALVVRRHDSAAPVFTLARAAGETLGAVALQGGSLFYFRGGDDTLWQHELAGGKSTPVTRLVAGGVVSPDGSGTIEPNLDVPPVWAPPYLFVGDRRLQAFRLAK